MEDELQTVDREILSVREAKLDRIRFIKLIQLIQRRTQLIEDDQSLKPFSEIVKLLGLEGIEQKKLVLLRNNAMHSQEGFDAELSSSEEWIKKVLIPAVLKTGITTSFIDDILSKLKNIGPDYGYKVKAKTDVRIGSSKYSIDFIISSNKIRAIGEIKENPTPAARAIGIRQLEIYLNAMKEDYGILILGHQNVIDEIEILGKSIFIVGSIIDRKKIFEWLDTQASYIRRRKHFELFDWSGKDFELGKELALYWLDLLLRTIRGETVNSEEAIIEYAHDELGLDLSTEAVRELYQIGGESQGLFYRMGFDGRKETWASFNKSVALKRLKSERKRIQNLNPDALVERWTHVEEDDKVTLVPTSSMDFDKQVLILRAYVVLSNMGKQPVHYKRVMTITNLARTQVSGVNAFFVGLGFLEIVEKGTYLPAKEVVKFYNETPGEEDYTSLQPVLMSSQLYDKIRSLILIHGKTTEDDLITYLLEESGETTRSRAKRALDWLECTGLISIDDNSNVHLLIKTQT